MKEVSCRAVSTCIDYLEGRKLPVNEILKGTSLTRELILDNNNRISWSEYCQVIKNFSGLVGGYEELEKFGRTLMTPCRSFNWFYKFSGLFASPRSLMFFVHKVGLSTLFSMMDSGLSIKKDGHMEFTIQIQEGHQDCPEFFHISKGIYSALPLVIGSQENKVTLKETGKKGTFFIIPPISRSLMARLKLAVKSFFNLGSILDEMSFQNDQMKKYIEELEINYRTIQETEREKSELLKKLAVINEKLESINLDNSQELVQNMLQMKKIIMEKNTMLAILTHDIVNPLCITKMSLNMVLDKLKKGQEEPRKVEFLEKCKMSLETVEQVIQNVRELMSVEMGKYVLELKTVPVLPILNNILHLNEYKVAMKKINIELDNQLASSGKGNTMIMAEEKSLGTTVFNNILSNGIKFSPPKGTLKIVIAESERLGDDDLIRIDFIDQGRGIPPELVDKLFSFSLPTTREGTSSERGTGFGLPITKTFMDLYGGKIEVDSRSIEDYKENSGTKVSLYFKNARVADGGPKGTRTPD